MIKIFFTAVIMAVATLGANAAETAASVLRHVVDRMSSQPVEARFGIAASGVTQDGTITLSGNRFVVITDDLSTWYDGKTQWTLAKAVNEVNVSEPSREELAEINPLLILSSLSSNFNAEMAGSTAGAYEILLAARNRDAGIASARVKVDPLTWFPSEIILYTNSGEQFTITIKQIKNLKTVADNTFRFQPANYPGVEIIDLR